MPSHIIIESYFRFAAEKFHPQQDYWISPLFPWTALNFSPFLPRANNILADRPYLRNQSWHFHFGDERRKKKFILKLASLQMSRKQGECIHSHFRPGRGFPTLATSSAWSGFCGRPSPEWKYLSNGEVRWGSWFQEENWLETLNNLFFLHYESEKEKKNIWLKFVCNNFKRLMFGIILKFYKNFNNWKKIKSCWDIISWKWRLCGKTLKKHNFPNLFIFVKFSKSNKNVDRICWG